MSLQERLRDHVMSCAVAPHGTVEVLLQAADEIDTLTARVAELEADAGRYRYIRAGDAMLELHEYCSDGYDGCSMREGEKLDAAIDKAMGAAGQQGFGNAR